MGDVERQIPEAEEQDNLTTAYTTTAVGAALLIAAVLVAVTAGVPAAAFPFVIGGFACLGWGVPQIVRGRNALPAPHDKEKELLSAIRNNGGSISPAEAAMETSLTVREADAMLTGLANDGHLSVEGHDGVLYYAIPNRRELGKG